MSELNTIYILSKGRPECITAQRLIEINYKDDWFIVCGNNDETLPYYKKIWGDKVIVFDWYEYVEKVELLDNFGVEDKASGAVPVRNAIKDISISRGEKRHWQFDDDITNFYILNPNDKKWLRISGKKLQEYMLRIATYADKTNLYCMGFSGQQDTYPDMALTFNKRVFNCFNFNNDNFVKWRGRVGDDLINAIDTYSLYNNYEVSFKMLKLEMLPVENTVGGLFDLYKQDGAVRKLAYIILASPYNVKGVKKNKKIHYKINWRNICPKILNEKYR